MITGTPQFCPWIDDPDPPLYWGEDDWKEFRRRVRAYNGRPPLQEDTFKEEDHPRDPRGRFTFSSGGEDRPAGERPSVPRAAQEKYFDAIEDAPVNEGIEAAEDNWRGGIADFGDPQAALDVQNMQGYFDYRSHLEEAARENLGEEFPVYRLMRREQLEAWRDGADIDPVGTTLDPEFAEKFENFAGFDKTKPQDNVLVRIPATPASIVMRGSREESELVINLNEISADTAVVIPTKGESRPGNIPEEDMRLINYNPMFDKTDAWGAQLEATIADMEKAGIPDADPRFDENYRMLSALRVYRAQKYDDVEAGKAGLHVVYDGNQKLIAATSWQRDIEEDGSKTALLVTGATEERSKTRSLGFVVSSAMPHYDRIQVNEWATRTESVKAIEAAGFERVETESKELATFVWGKALPKPIPDKMTDAEIQASINKVSSDLDAEQIPIAIDPGTHDFEVNGKRMTAAGVAHISGLFGAPMNVRIFSNKVRRENVDGVVAHEIEHVKLQTAFNAYQHEKKQVLAEPKDEKGIDRVMYPSGALQEGYAEKYPTYQSMHAAFYRHDQYDFAEADGVSNYSAEYWSEWSKAKTTANFYSAVHETLSEMARIKYETGKFPKHRAMKISMHRPSVKKGTQLYRDLYRAVDKVYKEKG